jgi:UDP-N-acetylmuramoyl-L-alanyl-D-glutamate--2,6-diaminopimelate ligase
LRLADVLERAKLYDSAILSGADLANQASLSGLTSDSRKVEPGYLFAALPGSRADGRNYVEEALARGASAVLAQAGTPVEIVQGRAALIIDPNPRRALALVAAAFYGRQPETLVAVTGTSGKTSVAHFTRILWQAAGQAAASLGTLGLMPEGAVADAPGSLTTPDPVALMKCLAALADAGFDHAVMEASSHGLDQYRLEGVRLQAACFTNLSHEHLDYHGTMERYFAAKRRLFADLLPAGAAAVINADSPQATDLSALAKARRHRLITFGTTPGADLALLERRPTAAGQALQLELFGEPHEVELPLYGDFQAMNLLAALGLVAGSGTDLDDVLPALTTHGVVPGRIELAAETPAGGRVFVDYAHKPAALAAVLETLRPHTAGRLWVVFGCGGDRDRAKRPLMGEIACRLADQVIVTDDNPRSERPETIRAAIMDACPRALEMGDRRMAIATAMLGLKAGDVLVVAGKGHESGQIVGTRVLPCDDREVAREIARELESTLA